MKRLLRDYVAGVGSYVGLIAVGLALTLTISSAIGYLPYSDRPGPGWTEPFFSLEQTGFYLSWSVGLLLPTAIYGTVVFACGRALRVFDAPLVITRVFGGLSAGLIALVVAAGMGWYISMAEFPVLVAAGLGVAWGALLLPRFLGPQPPHRSAWVRWAASVVLLAGTGGFYWDFLAPRYTQRLELKLVGVAPSEERLVSGRGNVELERQEIALLDSVLQKGRMRGLMTGMWTSGEPVHRARMVIVITGPVTAEARLRKPRGVSVVYIQRGDRWDMFPPNAPTIHERVTIGPGAKPNQITFAWPGSSGSTYTWAPDEECRKNEAPGSAR